MSSDVDAQIDRAIEKIDEALPKIHARCRHEKREGKPPTDAIPIVQFAKAHRTLRGLSEMPLLTDSGEEFRPDAVTGT